MEDDFGVPNRFTMPRRSLQTPQSMRLSDVYQGPDLTTMGTNLDAASNSIPPASPRHAATPFGKSGPGQFTQSAKAFRYTPPIDYGE